MVEAFAYLGYDARHVGGPGQTDVILDAPITGVPYRVIVDAKSNKHGKVADGSIDWLSLGSHRKDERADHILVVAPGFGGGNLLRRADEYGVTLLTGDELAELVRLHRDAPFGLVDLRGLFQVQGRATEAIATLRQLARAARERWRLLRVIVDLVRDWPSGVYPDAHNLWVFLAMRDRQAAPTLDDVTDAVGVLASRTVGILKANEGGGYILTMRAETAYRRLRALARVATDQVVEPSRDAGPAVRGADSAPPSAAPTAPR